MVFPTHVGVFPWDEFALVLKLSLPHARGGVSIMNWYTAQFKMSSPRTWGCFFPPAQTCSTNTVFPTHVGYFKKSINYSILNKKHPYLCGVLFI